MFTNLGEVYDSQTRMDQKQKEEDQNNKKDWEHNYLGLIVLFASIYLDFIFIEFIWQNCIKKYLENI